MYSLRRLLVVSLVLGVVFGLGSLQAGVHTAAAQAVTATVTCSGGGGTCTVTLNASIAAGGSVTVTLSNGSSITINCPSGCAAPSQYTVTMGAGSAVVPGNQCVNGSVPGPYGCTAAYIPYIGAYTPPVYIPVPTYLPTFNGYSGFNGGGGHPHGCFMNQGGSGDHHHHGMDNGTQMSWSGGGSWGGDRC